MPIFEFKCPVHGVVELVMPHDVATDAQLKHLCPRCQVCQPLVLIEWSVPAKRNPRYGEG